MPKIDCIEKYFSKVTHLWRSTLKIEVDNPVLGWQVEFAVHCRVDSLYVAGGVDLNRGASVCLVRRRRRTRSAGEEGRVLPDLVADGGDVRQVDEHHDRHQHQGYLSGARAHVQHHGAAAPHPAAFRRQGDCLRRLDTYFKSVCFITTVPDGIM